MLPASPPKQAPTELESLPQHLPVGVQAPKPTPSPKTGLNDMETLLQDLLPGIPAVALRAQLGPMRWDLATVVCFLYGKVGHGVGRCPELDETFPFMLLGWTVEKVGSSYVMILPRVAAERCQAENGI